MSRNEKGFSIVEVLIIIVIVGLVGTVGWLVYDRQSSRSSTNQNNSQPSAGDETTPADEAQEEIDYDTTDNGLKYPKLTGWTDNLNSSTYLHYGAVSLRSPDYSETTGHVSITGGAQISFQELEWTGIGANTSASDAISILKGEGCCAYYDPDSIKTTTVGGKQLVVFDSGHTSDGVTYWYKTAENKWLDIGFSVANNAPGYGEYKSSPHYQTFLTWLENFVKLNS